MGKQNSQEMILVIQEQEPENPSKKSDLVVSVETPDERLEEKFKPPESPKTPPGESDILLDVFIPRDTSDITSREPSISYLALESDEFPKTKSETKSKTESDKSSRPESPSPSFG